MPWDFQNMRKAVITSSRKWVSRSFSRTALTWMKTDQHSSHAQVMRRTVGEKQTFPDNNFCRIPIVYVCAYVYAPKALITVRHLGCSCWSKQLQRMPTLEKSSNEVSGDLTSLQLKSIYQGLQGKLLFTVLMSLDREVCSTVEAKKQAILSNLFTTIWAWISTTPDF